MVTGAWLLCAHQTYENVGCTLTQLCWKWNLQQFSVRNCSDVALKQHKIFQSPLPLHLGIKLLKFGREYAQINLKKTKTLRLTNGSQVVHVVCRNVIDLFRDVSKPSATCALPSPGTCAVCIGFVGPLGLEIENPHCGKCAWDEMNHFHWYTGEELRKKRGGVECMHIPLLHCWWRHAHRSSIVLNFFLYRVVCAHLPHRVPFVTPTLLVAITLLHWISECIGHQGGE